MLKQVKKSHYKINLFSISSYKIVDRNGGIGQSGARAIRLLLQQTRRATTTTC